MRKLTDDVVIMILPVLTQMGYELIGVEYLRAKTNILRIYIDKDSGVSVDDCALASAQISAILDVEDPISSPYQLEISSPGIARPLFVLEHYQRFLGALIKMRLCQAQNNRRRLIGSIKSVSEQEKTIELATELETITVKFDNIEKANLIAQF